ncbi:hypothetical protein JOD54_005489 [Actinokineospora baliensis]|nr:hypothetical protein [Actinokineospora baliensis]
MLCSMGWTCFVWGCGTRSLTGGWLGRPFGPQLFRPSTGVAGAPHKQVHPIEPTALSRTAPDAAGEPMIRRRSRNP